MDWWSVHRLVSTTPYTVLHTLVPDILQPCYFRVRQSSRNTVTNNEVEKAPAKAKAKDRRAGAGGGGGGGFSSPSTACYARVLRASKFRHNRHAARQATQRQGARQPQPSLLILNSHRGYRQQSRDLRGHFFLLLLFLFFNLTYSRWTSSLLSCLWSQRIFPSLPGSRLTIFYRDASSALLQLVNQWLNFTYSRSHPSRYERKNTNPT